MTFEQIFPLRFYINLAFREDRRADLELEFFKLGFSAERFPAIDGRWGRDKIFPDLKSEGGSVVCTPGLWASALSLRFAIREAERRKATEVFIFEDDAVFAPHFSEVFKAVQLPKDWGIIVLGTRHMSIPVGKSKTFGINRCYTALDSHAFGIRREYFRTVRGILGDRKNRRTIYERGIAGIFPKIQNMVPTYAMSPNLIWQRPGYSNALGKWVANYNNLGECMPAIVTNFPNH